MAPEFVSADPVSGEGDDEAVTETVTDEGDEFAEAAVLASWCRAARCLLRSLFAGPQWRGWQGEGAGVGVGIGEGGRE